MNKYFQIKNLCQYFDLSHDYFESRMDSDFKRNIHYLRPPSESSTKKPILWNIGAIEKWMEGDYTDEINELLARR